MELSGIILSIEQSGDRFLNAKIFSQTNGLCTVLFRTTGKKAGNHTPPDLFDEVECRITPGRSNSQALFVSDYQRISTFRELAIKPAYFLAASELSRFFLMNGSHLLEPHSHFSLLQKALASFLRARDPQVVLLKLFYCFARDEGLPVRESWLAGLTKQKFDAVSEILSKPVEQVRSEPLELCDLLGSIKSWMNTETELIVG